jgi:hypothetical protein
MNKTDPHKRSSTAPKWIVTAGGVLALLVTVVRYFQPLVAVVSLFQKLVALAVSVWNAFLSSLTANRSLWTVVGLGLLSITMTGVFFRLWSKDAFLSRMSQLYQENRSQFRRRTILTVVLFVIFAAVAKMLISIACVTKGDAQVLFPQEEEVGPIQISTSQNNGEVAYSFHPEAEAGGPRGFASLTFTAYGSRGEGGWVVALVPGANLKRYAELRFMIRGEKEGERLYLKARDDRGHEERVELTGSYLPSEGQISTQWQLAAVPFTAFGDVDFGRMDNFSLASDSHLNGTKPQTVRVGRFTFETAQR